MEFEDIAFWITGIFLGLFILGLIALFSLTFFYNSIFEATDGEHTGLITAIEHNNNMIWDADLVLTTDTLHVHAAGGLGKETVLMLSYNITLPAWGKDVERVPSYPTVKLIRDLKNVHI